MLEGNSHVSGVVLQFQDGWGEAKPLVAVPSQDIPLRNDVIRGGTHQLVAISTPAAQTHTYKCWIFLFTKRKKYFQILIYIFIQVLKKNLERDGGCLQFIQSFTVQCVSPQRTHWVDVCTDDFCNAPCEKVPYDDAAIVAANGQKGAPAVKCAGEGHADTVQGAICLLTTQIRRHN